MFKQFNYNTNVYGGTEYMGKEFYINIFYRLPKLNNYLCLIMPGMTPNLPQIISDKREIIAWVHNTPKQFTDGAFQILSHKLFINKVKYIIVPSLAAKHMFLRELPDYPEDKIYPIYNAIYPLWYNKEKFNNPKQIKIIHTSSADRGMGIMMDALKFVDEDFRLEVYNNFDPDLYPEYPIDERVRFYGKTPKATVKEAFESAHIFAYSADYEETFCLSMVEAMSAGCLPVYPNVGALAEVSNEFGILYKYPKENYDEHVELFAKNLTTAIKEIKSNNWNPDFQVDYINSKYSWQRCEEHWLELHDKL